jgi:hypothetical protein
MEFINLLTIIIPFPDWVNFKINKAKKSAIRQGILKGEVSLYH